MEVYDRVQKRKQNLINGESPLVYPVMQYRTYILDVEGVLADLSGCYSKAFSSAFAEFGIPFETERLEEYVSTPLDVLFSRYFKGCTCRYRDFVTKFMGEFDRAFASGFVVDEDAAAKVKELHSQGAGIGAVSDLFEMYVRAILSSAGVEDCVDRILSAERMAVPRPDPYCLNTLMREMGAEAGSAVLVAMGERNRVCAERAGIPMMLAL